MKISQLVGKLFGRALKADKEIDTGEFELVIDYMPCPMDLSFEMREKFKVGAYCPMCRGTGSVPFFKYERKKTNNNGPAQS